MDVSTDDASHHDDPRIRLSLGDLFVWMTLTGVVCFVSQLSYYHHFQSSLESILAQISLLIFGPMSMTGLYLVAKQHWCGLRINFQPGHWLLALLGTSTAFYLFSNVVMYVINPPINEAYIAKELDWLMRLAFYDHCGSLVMLLAVACFFPVRPRWRLLIIPNVVGRIVLIGDFLLAFAGMDGLRFRLKEYEFFQFLLVFTELAILFALTIWDVKTARSRDWLHWFGIGLLVMSSLLYGAQKGLEIW